MATEVITGEKVFQQWCIHCHGEDNSGPGTLRLARDKGGKMQIYAEYRYLSGMNLQHTLRFVDAGIEWSELADNWGYTIAKSLDSHLPLATGGDKQVITTISGRPATSPDYLVSWAILPGFLN